MENKIVNNYTGSCLSLLQNEFIVSQQKIIKDIHNHAKNKDVQLQNLKNNFEIYKNKTIVIKQQNIKLKKELYRYKHEIQILKENIQEYMVREQNLKRKLNDQESINNEKNNIIKNKQNEYESIINNLRRQNEEIKKNRQNMNELVTQNKILQQIVNKLQNEMGRLQQDLKFYYEKYESYKQLQDLQQKYRNMNEQKEKEYQKLRNKYQKLRQRLKNYQQQSISYLEQIKTQLAYQKQKNISFKNQITILHSKINQAQIDHNQYNKTIDYLLNKIQLLKSKLPYNQNNKIIRKQQQPQKKSPIYKKYFPSDSQQQLNNTP